MGQCRVPPLAPAVFSRTPTPCVKSCPQVDTTSLYKDLGVPKTASASDIRKAYTKLAREVRVGVPVLEFSGVAGVWRLQFRRAAAPPPVRTRGGVVI